MSLNLNKSDGAIISRSNEHNFSFNINKSYGAIILRSNELKLPKTFKILSKIRFALSNISNINRKIILKHQTKIH